VAAIHVAGVRGDPCGAVQRTAPQVFLCILMKSTF